MNTILKLAGVSAVLAAGLVTALEAAPRQADGIGPKLFGDRIAADTATAVYADAVVTGARATATDASPAPVTDCRSQAWPYVSHDCVDGTPPRRAVRTITIERRDSPATSTLVRVPVGTVASR